MILFTQVHDSHFETETHFESKAQCGPYLTNGVFPKSKHALPLAENLREAQCK